MLWLPNGVRKYESLRSFINDVTYFWTIFDLLLSNVTFFRASTVITKSSIYSLEGRDVICGQTLRLIDSVCSSLTFILQTVEVAKISTNKFSTFDFFNFYFTTCFNPNTRWVYILNWLKQSHNKTINEIKFRKVYDIYSFLSILKGSI